MVLSLFLETKWNETVDSKMSEEISNVGAQIFFDGKKKQQQ